METTIGPASVGDADRLVRLINEAYAVEAFFVDGPRVNPAQVEQLIAQQRLFKAVHREPIAGDGSEPLLPLVGCILYEEREAAAYFGLLAVDPAAQGNGLGRRLVAYVEDRARAAGRQRITLRVVNLRAELPPWYAKLGYRVVGTEPFNVPERQKLPCHFLLFEKEL